MTASYPPYKIYVSIWATYNIMSTCVSIIISQVFFSFSLPVYLCTQVTSSSQADLVLAFSLNFYVLRNYMEY